MLDRSRPFVAYVSSDGNSITTWTGGKLGDAHKIGTVQLTRQSFAHGRYMNSYRVTDVHGGEWYGRGSPGIAITLRPCKEQPTAVVFRVWNHKPDKGFNGDVIALFPSLPEYGGNVLCYEHIGQHSAADYARVIECTRPAKPEEYASLRRELEAAPYRYNLRVIARRAAK